MIDAGIGASQINAILTSLDMSAVSKTTLKQAGDIIGKSSSEKKLRESFASRAGTNNKKGVVSLSLFFNIAVQNFDPFYTHING